MATRRKASGRKSVLPKRAASKSPARAAAARNKATPDSTIDVNTNIKVTPGPDAIIIPPLFQIDHIGNLFEPGRPGQPVVRPDDLLAFRIEHRNLLVSPGTPPRLKKQGAGSAYLILHFPPQAITEECFFERAQPGTNDPDDPESGDPSETLRPPPVRARIAGESRLALTVPDGFDIPYTLEGILDACRDLALSVNPNARPPAPRRTVLALSELFDLAAIKRLPAAQRAALSSYAARSLQLAVTTDDGATLRMRQYSAGPALRALPDDTNFRVPDLSKRKNPPKPALPTSVRTAIEMPWRLIVSPHANERWHHATSPVTSPATGHTELWHTRLTAPRADGSVIEPPHADSQRTLRAVWALSGEGSDTLKPMQGNWPASSDLPGPSLSPFRMPMDDFDRFQICHLSSNFSVGSYAPRPVDTNLMMLSTLGAWLDSRGAWEPPGLSVEEWVHRASMARDHYVRIVYRGFLFPFGHRVSLVKVSERKFHNGARDDDDQPTIENVSGNTAYLRQRLFIVIRERERRFDLPAYQQLHDGANTRQFLNQLPFSSVKILTQVTPNLDDPTTSPSKIGSNGQRMFWPHVIDQPFHFQCVATDLDGRPIAFDMPMIFMDNTLACPRLAPDANGVLPPDFVNAEIHAQTALTAYRGGGDKRVVPFRRQRVALATSTKAGDTSVEIENVTFDAEVEKNNASMRNASDGLSRPVFFPRIASCEARIGALAHLTGGDNGNELKWNAFYLKHGFATNEGEVFVDVTDKPGMAMLDFSAQGDRSGGFVQPNLKPQALSRLAGPVMGDVSKFIGGEIPGGGGFPTSISDLPLPLLFGCIPLGELIEQVTNLAGNQARVPKFASEASSQLEAFVNGLVRAYGLIADVASQPAGVAKAGISVFNATLADLLAQAKAYAAAQVAPLQNAAAQVQTAVSQVAAQVQVLIDKPVDDAGIQAPLAALPAKITSARGQVAGLIATANTPVNGASLPSGLRQSVLGVAQQLDSFLSDLEQLPTLIAQGQSLYNALDAIVGQPAQLGALFSDPGQLKTRVEAVDVAIGPFKSTLGSVDLLAGAPRKVILDGLSTIEQVLGGTADLLKLVDMLTGDELTIRFDWNPEIGNWWLPGANKASDDPIFRANDKRGFLVAVEAKVRKNGASAPKIGVVCSLRHFDLVLIAPASFLELNFEKIEFVVDSAAKMDVDVVLSDIKFVGPLSFVETLRDLIPLDGFSDPPYLDITAQGIDAGFNIALPGITCGVLNINNLSLGAGFTVPFIGQPLSVRFNFCTREQPFLLTVYVFGGGGFFGVTVDPHGVQILEAAFEFGASLSVDFGVASGGVYVMAGLYFRMESDEASLTGYFRLGGHVDVLGLISASLELYLELRYEFESGKCVGKAQLTIEISVFVFSGSVTITCERKFAGSNGDPSLRQMLGHDASVPLAQELAMIDDQTDYAWREYCEAFA